MRRAAPGALWGTLSAALLLSACATDGTVATAPKVEAAHHAAVTAIPGLSPADRVRQAVAALDIGDRDKARAELVAALSADRNLPLAQSLLDQIDKDPKVLLGEKNYPYKLKPGETLSELASRFLGDANLFYALARYNGIDAPNRAASGQTLLIPGTPKKVAVSTGSASKKPASTPAVQRGATRDPGRASQLRTTALQHMNRGAIDRAVPLLRQALALDPGNTLIRKDLDRALRIQATVRSRS